MDEFICPDELGNQFPLLLQKNLAAIETAFNLDISLRGNKIMYSGSAPQAKKFKKYLLHLSRLAAGNNGLRNHDVLFSLNLVLDGKIDELPEKSLTNNGIRVDGKEVFAKTSNQQAYVQALREKNLIFGIGPAGTGKTFLAIAMALNSLINKKVERIVLTRPVVEAGEKLGFLPGDIQQKINPYLRPLYDALYFLIGFERTAELIEKGIIEIAPLAYMRGRTINDAFIILDEGQNTVNSQMKMFLTRFGLNSRVAITADITQIDLSEPKKSGIFKAIEILKNVPEIAVIRLTNKDVVRHPLIQKIIEAYARAEK
ncbi:MAG: PhoH family protein [Candidatus Aminicenantes bacterium]|nr:PhoH family protein [Candidatus Aminicenantes bacterium]